MAGFGTTELIIILVIVLVLFGVGRIGKIAGELGLDFKGDKSDMDEVIIGSGGRMCRFYLGYHSVTLGRLAKVKMEINFIDRIFYPFQTKNLQSCIWICNGYRLPFHSEDMIGW